VTHQTKPDAYDKCGKPESWKFKDHTHNYDFLFLPKAKKDL